MALDSAGGSPYLIQHIGDEAWTQAQPRDGSTVDPEAAVAQVRDNLDSEMFRGRWAKATPAEKAVISAIAQVHDPDGVASTADVSAVLAVDTRRWSMARRPLIDKDVVEPVAHGLLRFTMPGFGEFAAAQTDGSTARTRSVREDRVVSTSRDAASLTGAKDRAANRHRPAHQLASMHPL